MIQLVNLLNWAHRSMDKHTTHKIDHIIYLAIEEWNSAKRLASVNAFINKKSNQIIITMKYNGFNSHMKFKSTWENSNW